ncbi:hypothetical protein ACVBE9_11875 [Eionea flava]
MTATLKAMLLRIRTQLEQSIVGRWVLEVWLIFWSLVKIMLPVLLIVRAIELLGWITWLGTAISPLMAWVGLPGDMGLVWVSAMVSNLYAGMAIFYQLGGVEQLTVAQVSVLAGMMLIAHGLPVEVAIAKATGVSLWFTLLLRIGGGFLFGWLLHQSYSQLDALQVPMTTVWQPEASASDWASWLILQGQTLLAALVVIAALTLIIHLLRFVGIEKAIHYLLSPFLRFLGIGIKATNIIVVGLTLGLAFGGGILIREAKSATVDGKDIFLTMAFLGLCHSVIEDSLLMLLLGADLSAVLWARLVFGMVAIALLARIIRRLPDKFYTRLYKVPQA